MDKNMKYFTTLKKFICKSYKNKFKAEIEFWQKQIHEYVDWYKGLKILYATSPPTECQRVISYSVKVSAILTWFELHQKEKYYKDLDLTRDCFKGMKILDIGSGPFPSALIFLDCEVYCLDPLIPEYLKVGFPIHLYENRAKFSYGYSEEMPFEDNFFDAVLSVNAIDHVNDFEKTALEVKRVLKPGGLIRMHVHYHKATKTEPVEIDDERFIDAYKWVEGIKKLFVSKSKTGYTLENNGEYYALWSNF
jgi:ubiquinone/menaquinone biosynthesis C-methylase UbiE